MTDVRKAALAGLFAAWAVFGLDYQASAGVPASIRPLRTATTSALRKSAGWASTQRQRFQNTAVGRALGRAGQQISERYVAVRQQLGRRGRAALRYVKHTPLGQRVRLASRKFRGQWALLNDRLEAELRPGAARAFHRLRNLSPGALGSFAAAKVREDPAFLAKYGALSMAFTNAQTPVLMSMGVDPVTAVGLRFATGMPIDLSVLWWRQHQLNKRKDPQVTPLGTLRALCAEYTAHADRRRDHTRRFLSQWQAHLARKQAAPIAQGLQ